MARLIPWARYPIDRWWPADRMALERATLSAGILDDGGALAGRSAAQMKALINAFETYLGFLAMEGVFIERPACDLVTKEQLVKFVEALRKYLRPITVRNYLQCLTVIMRALYSDCRLEDLETVNNAVRRQSPLSSRIHRQHVAPSRLFALAKDLMTLDEDGKLSNTQLHRFRDGLSIAMLLHAPSRVDDFARIRIDVHLTKAGDRYRIEIPRTGKTGRGQMFWMDRWLTPPIDFYLEVIRTALLARIGRWHRTGADDYFWVNDHGGRLAGSNLSRRIGSRTEAALGVRVRAHQFRSIIATTIAIEDPEHVGIVIPLLAHSDIRTSEVHYNMADTSSAAVNYYQILGKVRTERGS